MVAIATPPDEFEADFSMANSDRILSAVQNLGSEVAQVHSDQGRILSELGENSRRIGNLESGLVQVNRRLDSMRPKVAQAVEDAERISEVPGLIDTGVKRGLEQAEFRKLQQGAETRKTLLIETYKVVIAVIVTAILGIVGAAFSFSRGFDAHRESVRLHGGP